ncbi:MAG: glycine--tRNA ligase subunit beta [Thermodesulfobacteriota bacterium]
MSRFVLEIGTEEMPARFLCALKADLERNLREKLGEVKLNFGQISTLATPRRIVGLVEDLDEKQEVENKLFIGPPARIGFDEKGQPTKAAAGFARSQGVDAGDLFVQETEKGVYVAVRRIVGGRHALDLLADICPECIKGLFFPKKMRWADKFTFGRPIRWILSLLDDEVVDFRISDVRSDRWTYGHRVQGPGPYEIKNAADFEQVLTESGEIVLKEEQRREIICTRGDQAALSVGGRVVWKELLLDEVANLVEHPCPVLGEFLPGYLELPDEVLLTSMEKHQKSFGVENESGKLLPYFLTTLNLTPEDKNLVQRGWERVLKARLEDARFFWESDLKLSPDEFVAKLDRVVFMAGLGSMGDKARRLSHFCFQLAAEVDAVDKTRMARAGLLAKFDLVTEMVGEFDSLQGIMGGIYARQKNEDELVCKAIYEHYLPEGPGSPVPGTAAGAILSLADKLDNLAGCFGRGMIPTGAADPYALRRQALGVMRILMDYGFDFDLVQLCATALDGYEQAEWTRPRQKVIDDLMNFLANRLRALWVSEVEDSKVVEAVIGSGFSRLPATKNRLLALVEFTSRKGYAEDVLTFKRADNIIRKQSDFDLTGKYERTLFESEHENRLADKIEEILPVWDKKWMNGDFSGLLDMLKELRPYVDDFFDNVMVMAEEADVRKNRFNLLYALTSRLACLADFSALQV